MPKLAYTMPELSTFWPHLGALHEVSSLWCGDDHRHRECTEKQTSECVPTCCNRRTQQVTEVTAMQNRNYSAYGTYERKHWGQQGGGSSRNTQHQIDHSLLRFAAPINSISSNHHDKISNSLQNTNETSSQ
jgi:hypothetical protein